MDRLRCRVPLGPLLGCFLLLLGPCRASCPRWSMGNVTEPQYEHIPGLESGLSFMSGIVQSFLGLVQPNPFPKDLIMSIVKNHTFSRKDINEVLQYEAGFLVCVAIGILYLLLMPLVGICFACCRCCGNCGGHMYQEQTKRMDCQRRLLYCFMFLITFIMLAGNVCMFLSSQSTTTTLQQAPDNTFTIMNNVQKYLKSLPEQVQSVENESFFTIDMVKSNLGNISFLLGSMIQRDVKGPLMPALDSVRNMSQVVKNTSDELSSLNVSLVTLQSQLTILQYNLTSVRIRINGTLSNPKCLYCNRYLAALDTMPQNMGFNVPNIYDIQSAVDIAQKADLDSKVKMGEDFINNIPQVVENKTESTVQSAQTKLQDVRKQINKMNVSFSMLDNVFQGFNNAKDFVNKTTPVVKSAEMYSWIVGVILCCLVLLVVICNIMGLLLGPWGLMPNAKPTERSCAANCGGNFLMAGVGFSFIFSWIFMLLVLILFLVGGNSYTMICKPWKSQEIYEIIDQSDLNFSTLLGFKGQLSLQQIYRDCQQNQPLWPTLHLEDAVDLNAYLNISKYADEIWSSFDKTNITIPTITLMTSETAVQLKNITNIIGQLDLQQTDYFSNLSANLTNMADQLQNLSNVQPDSSIKYELAQEAQDLRNIISMANNITSNLIILKHIKAIVSNMNVTVEDVLTKVAAAQIFLNHNLTDLVKRDSRIYVGCQIEIFKIFADWANMTITQQIGRCGPVAEALNSVEVIVCSKFIGSLNGFWFSLGWCTIFLIPSIILSVKLAKFYRRMKYSDFYE
ncbi:prominin-2 isoform X2 [Denticeps clupeoides]|nr:prominin-1-A-like isoform X2 [Denticeps clupeoides]